MPTTSMIIVAGGSSTRFGADKLMADIDGTPLLAHTIDAVVGYVDTCVVACRPEMVDTVEGWGRPVTVTAGGASRTLSEMAGLAAIGEEVDLIGIHDAARPVVDGALIEGLFAAAERFGGAIPTISGNLILLDRRTHARVDGLAVAQTPQVFRSAVLMTAYVRAAQAGFEGHDTAEVVERFTDATIVAVPGDPDNIKVTYPDDLGTVTRAIRSRSRT